MVKKGYHLQQVEICLTQNLVYGKGSDAQVAATTILQHFQQRGFMCSLDYTKCFDLPRPAASKQLLDATGCCPCMSTLCKICGLNMLDGLRAMVFLAATHSTLKVFPSPKRVPPAHVGQRFVEEISLGFNR